MLFLPSVRSGGAERVLSSLANLWVENGNVVKLVSINPGDDFYRLSERVERLRLDIQRSRIPLLGSIWVFLKKLYYIRKSVLDSKPQVIVSFLNQLNIRVLLACRNISVPIIISERIAPEYTSAGIFWKIARTVLYPRAKLIVAQTERESKWFKDRNLPTVVIPNVITANVLPYKWNPKPVGGFFKIIAIGRFTRQKGFDLLIKAFSVVAKKNPESRLYIYGRGPEHRNLLDMIKFYSLHDKCFLPGVIDNPFEKLSKSDLFVLSSRYEGFPNVLAEAMAIGVPSVAFDCPNGPQEMIKNKETGILVKGFNPESLAEAIIYCITNPDLLPHMSMKARESIRKICSPEMVINKWNDAISSVL